jgi:IPT/TIG domain
MMTLLLLDVPAAKAAAPTITSFNPTSGPVGTSVQINGTGFQDGTDVSMVTFNGVAAVFTLNSDVLITATVPSGASDGNIAVTDSEGTAVSPSNFDVIPLAITAFAPASGAVGTAVVIMGTGFTGATAVTFGGTAASFVVNSSTQITATVPTGAITGPISVASPGGTTSSAANFAVTPTITSFNPTSGPVGTSVVITGTGFTGVSAVTFNALAAVFTVNSSTQITATVPLNATTGPIRVSTPGGTATSSTNFTVTGQTPPPIEKHRSNVTLELSGHLVASGDVRIPDGTGKCDNGRRVNVQRYTSGHWKTIRQDRTGSNGQYRSNLPDKSGKYRTQVTKKKVTNDLCNSDVSKAKKYTKPAPTGGSGGGSGGGGGTQNCTPGYSPCLIYHGGADYDCAGGSGNGPYYTQPGVVYTVSGSDPYGLDADNDGRGCE